MKKNIIFLFAILCLAACQEKYVASVTDLRLVRVDPPSGYEGDLIKILGRNFSTAFGENHVYINGKEARIVEFDKDQLTVVAPENDLGTYSVEVETPLGTVSSEAMTFTYKKRPEKLYSVTTIAGNGTNQHKDEIGTSAAISQIEGLAWAPDGTIWFCQRNAGYAIRQYSLATQMVRTVVSGIPLPWGGDFDAEGNYYFPGKDAKKVYKIAKGSNSYEEFPLDASIALNSPMYVKFDLEGNMWIASRGNNTVYKVKNGVLVKAYTGDKYFPVALTMDAVGRIYFASTQDKGIFMIDGETVTKVVGTGTTPTIMDYEVSLANGPLNTNVGNIGGMYIGKDGALYYTDFLTFTIVKVVPDETGDFSKGKISILAGLPFSSAIVNGTTDMAQFKYPSGIIVSDDCKKIYVGEPTGYVLRMIDLS